MAGPASWQVLTMGSASKKRWTMRQLSTRRVMYFTITPDGEKVAGNKLLASFNGTAAGEAAQIHKPIRWNPVSRSAQRSSSRCGLRAYAWPGNIRELRNVVFGALVNKRSGGALLVSDLPRRLWARTEEESHDDASLERRLLSGSFNLRRELERLERRALELALRRANGNAAEAARLLGEVGRGSAKDPGGTVRTMMKRLKLGPS